jgi:hypothetical protein
LRRIDVTTPRDPWDRAQIFWVTERLAVGPHPGGDADGLLREGITHVLNVGESPSTRYADAAGDRLIIEWISFPDGPRIADGGLRQSLQTLRSMATTRASRVLVHCVAGHNRSPTIIWLYLIATGMPSSAAEALIAVASFDSVPGHPRLVDASSVALAEVIGGEWREKHGIQGET